MTRTSAILTALDWSQKRLASEIGVTQTTIWRLARGDAETGPMRLALNHVAAKYGLTDLVLADVPRPDLVTEGAGDAVA